MEQTSKRAADRVNNHREDGEESFKRTGQVVPIDEAKKNKSVQVTPESVAEKNKSADRENE